MSHKRRILAVLACSTLLLWMAVLPLWGAATDPGSKPESASAAGPQGESIKVESVRLTGAGHFIDFRFRVLDPEKAATLLHRSQKAVLIDQATNTELPVPVTKLGAIRQTTLKPEKNRVYFMLFSNAGNVVKRGSTVNVRIGDLEARDIVVQ